MITIMDNLPANVLGVSAEGKITRTDYKSVLIPVVEEQLNANKKLRMLYQLGNDFTGFELTTLLDEARMGMKYLSTWDRIALVSEHLMANTFAKFFSHMVSCEFRVFKNTELEEAKKWIAIS
jgi:hypothetical protein